MCYSIANTKLFETTHLSDYPKFQFHLLGNWWLCIFRSEHWQTSVLSVRIVLFRYSVWGPEHVLEKNAQSKHGSRFSLLRDRQDGCSASPDSWSSSRWSGGSGRLQRRRRGTPGKVRGPCPDRRGPVRTGLRRSGLKIRGTRNAVISYCYIGLVLGCIDADPCK